jgi:hypothetical protein
MLAHVNQAPLSAKGNEDPQFPRYLEFRFDNAFEPGRELNAALKQIAVESDLRANTGQTLTHDSDFPPLGYFEATNCLRAASLSILDRTDTRSANTSAANNRSRRVRDADVSALAAIEAIKLTVRLQLSR